MVSEFLGHLERNHRITLRVDSGRLMYRAPKGAMTPELRALIRQRETQIIRLLSGMETGAIKYPLSFNQQSIWFMHQIAPESSCYHIAACCRVVSELDIDALSASIRKLVERHDILRATYVYEPEGGTYRAVMAVASRVSIPLDMTDASRWSDDELKDRVEEAYARPFDLEKEPVIRFHLFKASDLDHVLLITIHHIACDAHSLGILLHELGVLYRGETLGEAVLLPAIEGGYKDFTVWQKEMLKSEAGARHKDFWLEQLEGPLPVLDLPSDFPRPNVPSYRGESFYFYFDGDMLRRIDDFCRQESVTRFVFFLSLFQLFLMKHSTHEDILVGTPVIGRGRPEFRDICGNFINTLALRSRFEDSLTFRDHLKRTKRTVLGALDHQDYPFSLLVEELMPQRDSSRSPVFQVMFNMLDQKTLGDASAFLHGASFDEPRDWGGLKVLPFPLDQEEGQFDLTLEMIGSDERIACVFKYSTDLFEEKTIAEFAGVIRGYAERALENPEVRLSSFQAEISRKAMTDREPVFDERRCMAIAATFTADLLKEPLEFWVDKLSFGKSVVFAPYNQVIQQLLDPSSLFRKNTQGINVILVRLEDWIKEIGGASANGLDTAGVKQVLNRNGETLLDAVKSWVAQASAPLLVCFCPRSLAEAHNPSLIRAEEELVSSLDAIGNVYPVPSFETTGILKVENYDEPLGVEAGHIPYTDDFFTALSCLIARKAFSIFGKPYKAIVLDCDQTLWKGVVGEDGVMGVQVDDARKKFQELLVAKHEAGTLICLCSKNVEEDVFDVLDNHPDMILRRNHVSYSRINWEPKSGNIRDLAREINIGLDSFIFIDDNPLECAEVRAACPEVLTLQLPSEPEKIRSFTDHVWAFDHLKLTREDRERVELYRQERERSRLFESSSTFEDFLRSLDLKVSITDMEEGQIQRVSQMTLRTNQFNLTTIRRNESEIARLSASDHHACLVADVSDRFGNYGLVGLVVLEFKDDLLDVDTFLLSCRALGKGVEFSLLNELGKRAMAKGLASVRLTYQPTRKNQPALNFLMSLGAEYRQETEEGLTVVIPAGIAADMTMKASPSEEKKPEGAETPLKEDAHPVSALSIALVLEEIAGSLSTVKAVASAIKGRKSPMKKARITGDHPGVVPVSRMEKTVAAIWSEVLGIDDIGMEDNFFDLGGTSILMPGIVIRLSKTVGRKISIVDMFQNPTIRMMAGHIVREMGDEPFLSVGPQPAEGQRDKRFKGSVSGRVAIIGMAGRFPGAPDVRTFWTNLVNGVESITDFSDEELLEAGVPEFLVHDPGYVKRSPVLEDFDRFDAGFFGYNPREAEKIDPQQRLFLECAWDAFEDAGYVPDQCQGAVGVFAGCGMNNYLLKNLLVRPEMMESVLNFQTFIGNDKDFLSTRVSYKLGLKGPSLSVQTACSTSLVAIQLACQSLLTGQCDLALSGGVSLQTPRLKGYLYHEGEIFSKDGYCRPFDAEASGTLLGEGVGVVLLKRLEEAIEDRDHIYAVIRGAALNNDGQVKAGYTAPSVQGQAAVIEMAQAMADIDPCSIGYVEAHGTGTALGDPIEVTALCQAFRKKTDKKAFCAIGSVKSNIGHLDVAAGVAGLIKASFMVRNGILPPTLHVTSVNPELHIADSPFYVNDRLRSWDPSLHPRRAGVSSFGVGGTNAHVILEEPPEAAQVSKHDRPCYLFTLSARSETALDLRKESLRKYLEDNRSVHPGDVAFTLQAGRKSFRHRLAFVCRSLDEFLDALGSSEQAKGVSGVCRSENRQVAFMFSGQGSQYVGMAKDLFDLEPFFRKQMETCSAILKMAAGIDLFSLIYPGAGDDGTSREKLTETALAQPALFALEYSLARLFMEWGLQPRAMIGHSLGEYTAACLAGVFSLEDGLRLVAERGRLMQQQPRGDMLAVALPENELSPYLEGSLALAVVNAPGRCVVSGSSGDIASLKATLENATTPDNRKIQCTLLHTSHGFHSEMMEGAIGPLKNLIGTIKLNRPQIPFISNVTGTWITDDDATDPEYWARHLRRTVRFSEGVRALAVECDVLLEVGPGQTLATLARQNMDKGQTPVIQSSVRHPQSQEHDVAVILRTLAQLWVAGVQVNWLAFNKDRGFGRVSLPGYPFDRQRYWIDPVPFQGEAAYQVHRETQDMGAAPATALYSRPSHVSSEFRGPVTEYEKAIASIWSDVLGIDQIGIHDSFFELGGDSLIAAQIVSRIREKFGAELQIRMLFERPTIKDLAGYLEQEKPVTVTGGMISRAPGIEGLQLSLAQQRLWFINQLEPHSPAYNIVQAVRISGETDPAILQKALDTILERHEGLRMVFKVKDGLPAIERGTAQSIVIERVDCSDRNPRVAEEKARSFIVHKAPVLFDLERGPLVRAWLFTLGPSESVFAMVMHHIVADGWSMGVWMRELAELYEAYRENRPSTLKDLRIHYSDYASWQKKWLEACDFSQQKAYWAEQLGGELPVIQLPSDHPRPMSPRYTGRHRSVRLSPELTEKIRILAREEQATVYAVLLSAYFTLLSKYSRQQDIVVGTPYANRDRLETEDLIGFFINMLPIRIATSGPTAFRDLVKLVQRLSLDALSNKDLPFEKLVEMLHPERSLNHHPIFQVMFAFQNFPMPSDDTAGLKINPMVMDRGATEFELSLYMWEEGDELKGVFEYSDEIFADETIGRLAGHFENLVRSLTEDPLRPVQHVGILTEAEKALILDQWNDNQLAYPNDRCLHELFDLQAGKTPDAVAVVHDKERISFKELKKRTDQLAEQLDLLGIGPDVLVGICLERSIDMIAGMLAILKAGGAYVPLDPNYPVDRLRFMLEDSDSPVVLTQKKFRHLFQETGRKQFIVDEEREKFPAKDSHFQKARPTPGNLAYVIYTSGSTGVPKGVAIEHRSPVALIAWAKTVFSDDEIGGMLASTSICFDLSIFEIFLPLATGGKIILADNALELPRLPAVSEVRLVNTVPSAIIELLKNHSVPPGVTTVNLAGEPLKQDVVDQLYALGTVQRVYDLYGPSEDTTYSTWTLRQRGGRSTIGKPIANTRLYILDAYRNPVPIGVPGEIFISGAGLARGYLHRPELTGEKFVSDIGVGQAGERFYRTGDLARFYPDGNIDFMGRMDHQVKVRGFRIELGEIETAILAFGGIRQCVVVVREDVPGDQRLVAYLVPDHPAWADEGGLRQNLKTRLPEYMIPQHVVILASLPMTSNGKIDRKNLPAPFQKFKKSVPNYSDSTEMEAQLLEIWRKAIGLDYIGLDDNFFEIGGHSILSVRIFSEIYNLTGVNLPLAVMFKSPTVRELARTIEEAGGRVKTIRKMGRFFDNILYVFSYKSEKTKREEWAHLVPIKPKGSRTPLFCMHAVGGNVMNYKPLASRLDREQPVYGLQARGLDGLSEPYPDIRMMAARYIEAMRTLQPKGPYLLAGGSMGGAIALETAIQLKSAGEEIALLAMFDTYSPNYDKKYSNNSKASNLDKFLKRFESLYESKNDAASFFKQVGSIYGSVKGKIRIGWNLSLSKGFQKIHIPIPHKLRYWYVEYRNWATMLKYMPEIYDGDLTLFSESGTDDRVVLDVNKGWNEFITGDITVIEVPAKHSEFMEDIIFIEKFASYLQSCYQKWDR